MFIKGTGWTNNGDESKSVSKEWFKCLDLTQKTRNLVSPNGHYVQREKRRKEDKKRGRTRRGEVKEKKAYGARVLREVEKEGKGSGAEQDRSSGCVLRWKRGSGRIALAHNKPNKCSPVFSSVIQLFVPLFELLKRSFRESVLDEKTCALSLGCANVGVTIWKTIECRESRCEWNSYCFLFPSQGETRICKNSKQTSLLNAIFVPTFFFSNAFHNNILVYEFLTVTDRFFALSICSVNCQKSTKHKPVFLSHSFQSIKDNRACEFTGFSWTHSKLHLFLFAFVLPLV